MCEMFCKDSVDKTEEGEAPAPPPPPLVDPGTRLLYSALDRVLPDNMLPPEPNYKNIKLLGTKMDTNKDSTARKIDQSVAATPKDERFLQVKIKTPQPPQNQNLQDIHRNNTTLEFRNLDLYNKTGKQPKLMPPEPATPRLSPMKNYTKLPSKSPSARSSRKDDLRF